MSQCGPNMFRKEMRIGWRRLLCLGCQSEAKQNDKAVRAMRRKSKVLGSGRRKNRVHGCERVRPMSARTDNWRKVRDWERKK